MGHRRRVLPFETVVIDTTPCCGNGREETPVSAPRPGRAAESNCWSNSTAAVASSDCWCDVNAYRCAITWDHRPLLFQHRQTSVTAQRNSCSHFPHTRAGGMGARKTRLQGGLSTASASRRRVDSHLPTHRHGSLLSEPSSWFQFPRDFCIAAAGLIASNHSRTARVSACAPRPARLHGV